MKTTELPKALKTRIADAISGLSKKVDKRAEKYEELFSVAKEFEGIKTAAGHPIKVGVRSQSLNVNGVVGFHRIITLEKEEPLTVGFTSPNVFVPLSAPFAYCYWAPHDGNYYIGSWTTAPLGAQPFGCIEEVVVGLTERIIAN
jgi:hypothetical protein